MSEAMSQGMREYWAAPGVKRQRKDAANRRRHIRMLERRLRNRLLTAELRERTQRELDELLAEHEQASTR
jgi:hypothetical protein